MSDLVTLTIDEQEISVPAGTVVVDAAKRLNNDIPVFCYHPKLKPVGMCRMCLVEVGTPVRDRATGELLTDENGEPQIRFFPTLQTGCTVQVSEGMVVRTQTDDVTDARDDIVEFLLTSHPLDCPICDKGGECPLQNLTMRFGPGTSRFVFEDKIDLAKNVPLGDLIYLDRERCIQCARCTRFQSEIVDDPVIALHNRGRELEIVTMSEPGFDSYWSGNTTDICPVGALTTADFRFGARPWELTPVASICTHCPVGCNTTLSTRQEARSAGRTVIKRVLSRQNEYVNELWICDKGRFAHHYADSSQRLTKPLIREEGQLVETTWDEALDLVAGRLQMNKESAAGLASGRLTNEDLFLFQKLFRQGLQNNNIDLVDNRLAGGDIVSQVGLASDSNLGDLGSGDAILVVASDLHEEAPVWWLRVKQAAERGAKLVQINLRRTRLDKFSTQTIHHQPGETLSLVQKLVNAAKVDAKKEDTDPVNLAADLLIEADNLVVFYGSEGLAFEETDTLARLLANMLLLKQVNGDDESHAGRINSGLIPVWPRANMQGAWDMGLRPDFAPGYKKLDQPGLDAAAIYKSIDEGDIKALYLAGADPVGDGLLKDRGQLDFLVVQELFLTESAKLADVVLPAQSWAEREGSFTSGERRVQRFYPAIPPFGESRPDWQIFALVGERAGLSKPPFAASLAFREIAEQVPQYAEMSYRTLAWTEEQWPVVGEGDLYYGGAAHRNDYGLGQQWPAAAEQSTVEQFKIPDVSARQPDGLVIVSTTALYSQGLLLNQTELLKPRIAKPKILLNSADAQQYEISDGDTVSVLVNGEDLELTASVNGETSPGLGLLQGVNSVNSISPATLRKVKIQEE